MMQCVINVKDLFFFFLKKIKNIYNKNHFNPKKTAFSMDL